MITDLDPKVIKLLKEGTPAQRKYICEKEPAYFFVYYFSEFYNYEIAPFHWQFYDDLKKLVSGDYKEIGWIAFRESAKTSIAKLFIVWCICFEKKKYINFDSYDKDNSEAALFDISVWLQTNKKLISDFGNLYYGDDQEDKTKKIKRLNNFVTANGIKVEAFSTQEPTRGRIYQNVRPDLFVLDDIENAKTKKSFAITATIVEHINELKAGLSSTGSVIYLGNYLTENGVIAGLIEGSKSNKDVLIRNIPVAKGEELMWPDKYTFTDAEAVEENKTRSKEIPKVSLESKRRALGNEVFETEMMNNPAAAEDYFFDKLRIEADIKKIEKKLPVQDLAGFKIWHEFDPSHRYAIGADISEGVEKDSSASVCFDFSTVPHRVVSTYYNNVIDPSTFAFELRRQGDYFGGCLLAPELNNVGFATVTTLLTIYDPDMIYRHTDLTKIEGDRTESKKHGWRTTSATKSKMFYDFKKAYEDGVIEIWDIDLLKEMSSFTKADLSSSTTTRQLVTRHFDLLTAACIGYQMRDHAVVMSNNADEDYKKKVKAVKNLETKPLYEEIGL